MTVALQVRMDEVADAPRLEREVARGLARLERCSDQIERCQVWIQAPHGRHLQGWSFAVGIRVTVPGGEIVVSDPLHADDPHTLVRRSFEAARSRLQEYVESKRRKVTRKRARGRRTSKGEH